MTQLRVRDYERDDAARWEAFVAACPAATFFHRIGWPAVVKGRCGPLSRYLLAERAGEIAGVLPLAEVKSLLFGHALVSLPFCAVAGVAAFDAEAAQALHRAARTLGARIGAQHLELRNPAPREPTWPRQDLYASFRKALAPEVEANMLAIPRKQRAMVRKGIKNALASELDPGVERFFELYADNVHRHGTPPLPKRYFEALRATFGEDAEVLTVVSPEGKAVSSVLSFYFKDEVLPYYAGDRTEARDLAANDFKYWELMRRACEKGVRIFDFGRSKQGTGPFDFKRNWGFEPAPLAYEYCLYRRARAAVRLALGAARHRRRSARHSRHLLGYREIDRRHLAQLGHLRAWLSRGADQRLPHLDQAARSCRAGTAAGCPGPRAHGRRRIRLARRRRGPSPGARAVFARGHGARDGGGACRPSPGVGIGVSARRPAARRSVRGGIPAALDGMDRGFHRCRTARDRDPGVSGRDLLHHPVGALGRGRGVQRPAQSHRLRHRRGGLCVPDLPHLVEAGALPRAVDRGAARRQLRACLHDRAGRAFEQHEACRGRRSLDLRLGVLRAGDRPALLARRVLARACGACAVGARFRSSPVRASRELRICGGRHCAARGRMAALRAVHRPDGPRACPPHRAGRGCGLVGRAAEGHGLAAALPWGGGVDARGLSPWSAQRGPAPRVLPQPAPGCRARELAESHRGCRPLALVEDRRVDGHRGVAQRQGGGAAPDPAGVGGRSPSGVGLVSHRRARPQQSVRGESAPRA